MECTEDIIGNSAVSEDDNTNQSQNDYGDDCVDGDCDRKSDDHDGDAKRDEGCGAADGNSCDAKVTNNQVGATTDDKIDDGYDDYNDGGGSQLPLHSSWRNCHSLNPMSDQEDNSGTGYEDRQYPFVSTTAPFCRI